MQNPYFRDIIYNSVLLVRTLGGFTQIGQKLRKVKLPFSFCLCLEGKEDEARGGKVLIQ